MYFLQKGMQKVKPMITMVALSIIPMVTYMTEAFFDKSFYIEVGLILLLSTALSLLYLFKFEKK